MLWLYACALIFLICYLNIYLTEEFFIILKPGDFFSAYSIILS